MDTTARKDYLIISQVTIMKIMQNFDMSPCGSTIIMKITKNHIAPETHYKHKARISISSCSCSWLNVIHSPLHAIIALLIMNAYLQGVGNCENVRWIGIDFLIIEIQHNRIICKTHKFEKWCTSNSKIIQTL